MISKIILQSHLRFWLILLALMVMCDSLAQYAKAQDTFIIRVNVIVIDEAPGVVQNARIIIPKKNVNNKPTEGETDDTGFWTDEVTFAKGSPYTIQIKAEGFNYHEEPLTIEKLQEAAQKKSLEAIVIQLSKINAGTGTASTPAQPEPGASAGTAPEPTADDSPYSSPLSTAILFVSNYWKYGLAFVLGAAIVAARYGSLPFSQPPAWRKETDSDNAISDSSLVDLIERSVKNLTNDLRTDLREIKRALIELDRQQYELLSRQEILKSDRNGVSPKYTQNDLSHQVNKDTSELLVASLSEKETGMGSNSSIGRAIDSYQRFSQGSSSSLAVIYLDINGRANPEDMFVQLINHGSTHSAFVMLKDIDSDKSGWVFPNPAPGLRIPPQSLKRVFGRDDIESIKNSPARVNRVAEDRWEVVPQ